MAEAIAIKAKSRDRVGKGAARELRREGRVPGVIYGDKQAPESITVDFTELARTVNRGNFLSTVVELDVDGAKIRAIPRDLQVDPVRDFPVHVDFLRLAKGARIAVDVPVRFLNDTASPGLKRGGVLNIVRHAIELYCPAEEIPPFIEVDLTGLEIGDSVHISAIRLPEGATPVIKRDFTVVTIAGRMAEVVETDEAAAVPGAVEAEAGEAEGEDGDSKEGEEKD